MRYLKTFESYNELSLGEEIAQDLLPRFQKMRSEGQIVTVADFDKYMEERGADSELSDSVMHYLVNMGFDFDIEGEDEDYEDVEFELRTESLSYSGGDVTKMPIIGKIKTKPIAHFDGTTYDVVEIVEDGGKKYYICNFWYKDGRVPQIVHEDMVEEFSKKGEEI
jgi:hypothetical protein